MSNKVPLHKADLSSISQPDGALAALEQAVKGKEDFVYTSAYNGGCFYYPTTPNPEGCLIGKVLATLGVDVEKLPDGPVDEVLEGRVEDLATLEILRIAQQRQDDQETWGEALEAARERARELKEEEW